MALYSFRKTPTQLVDKDLIQLRNQLGGQLGRISVGTESVGAIRLRENLYVTTRKFSRTTEKVINMEHADIHQVDHTSDTLFLKSRLASEDLTGNGKA